MKTAMKAVLVFGIALGVVSLPAGTLSDMCPAPQGCHRVELPDGSFGKWLRILPMRDDLQILAHDGSRVNNDIYDVWAVADRPLMFKGDLEQCADWCMRLWADWHKESGKLGSLYLFNYSGERQRFNSSGRSYRSFLKRAFAYSNSFSLKRGCRKVADDSLSPGDMFVQNETGGIGHVSMVLDACTGTDGKRYYLVGYSFMPAQEFHVERTADEYGRDGWFTLDGFRRYLRDNLNLGKPVLRRWLVAGD